LIVTGEFDLLRTYRLEWWYSALVDVGRPEKAQYMDCVHSNSTNSSQFSTNMYCTIPDGVHFNIVTPAQKYVLLQRKRYKL
jgi:hypothetical protein